MQNDSGHLASSEIPDRVGSCLCDAELLCLVCICEGVGHMYSILNDAGQWYYMYILW